MAQTQQHIKLFNAFEIRFEELRRRMSPPPPDATTGRKAIWFLFDESFDLSFPFTGRVGVMPGMEEKEYHIVINTKETPDDDWLISFSPTKAELVRVRDVESEHISDETIAEGEAVLLIISLLLDLFQRAADKK